MLAHSMVWWTTDQSDVRHGMRTSTPGNVQGRLTNSWLHNQDLEATCYNGRSLSGSRSMLNDLHTGCRADLV